VSGAPTLTEDSVPRLARHVKFRFDDTRQRWLLLAPERVLMPDEIAVEILKRCDGIAAVAGIVDGLAAQFDADRARVADDVLALLQDLLEKGVLAT
jgi:pyrroloquinoline quinone biosynthesis protein D